MIQVFKPSIDEREINAVADVMRSGWIGLGPKTAEFERRFAEYVGAPFAVATNSGTAALHLALLTLGVRPGDEVLVPTLTFVSTAHAVSYCGARPVFVDVELDTLCMSVNDTERMVTERTAALLPVHYAGHPCDLEFLRALAHKHGLLVVEDAAHACGATYNGERIGSMNADRGSDAVCFSFHAVKNLTCGEGGMLVLGWQDDAQDARRMAWCGIDKTTWQRTEAVTANTLRQYGWYYEVHDVGYKYHMSDIAAAIGLVQLDKLEATNARRREIVTRYNAEFANLGWLTLPIECENIRSSWHAYVVRTEHRDRLNLYLKDNGIATGVHYMPLHLQPVYKDPSRATLPVTEAVWPTLLTLPLYPDLTDDEVGYVIEKVVSFGKRI